jgi:hypothetical protein
MLQRSEAKFCCRLMQDLAQEFATAARLYAEAVVILATQATSRGDFERLRLEAKDAQERLEEARMLFEAHVISHRYHVTDVLQVISTTEEPIDRAAQQGSASTSRGISRAAKAS